MEILLQLNNESEGKLAGPIRQTPKEEEAPYVFKGYFRGK